MAEGDDDAAWEQIEKALRAEGALSPGIKSLLDHLQAALAHWFKMARDINRAVQAYYMDNHDTILGRHVTDPVQLGMQLVPRALSSFQGSIKLAESGLGQEAQSLVRAIYEVNFWSGYLHSAGSKAANELERYSLTSEISLRKEVKKRWSKIQGITLDDVDKSIAEHEERLQEIGGKFQAQMSTVAEEAGLDMDYVFYRELSGGATHTSFRSMQDYLWVEDDKFHGHKLGPDEEVIEKALAYGCHAMLRQLEVLANLVGRPISGKAQAIYPKFTAMFERFGDVPQKH